MWSLRLRKITELTAGLAKSFWHAWLFLAVFDSAAITYCSRLSAIIGETYKEKEVEMSGGGECTHLR
jgi:hypothetical protein